MSDREIQKKIITSIEEGVWKKFNGRQKSADVSILAAFYQEVREARKKNHLNPDQNQAPDLNLSPQKAQRLLAHLEAASALDNQNPLSFKLANDKSLSTNPPKPSRDESELPGSKGTDEDLVQYRSAKSQPRKIDSRKPVQDKPKPLAPKVSDEDLVQFSSLRTRAPQLPGSTLTQVKPKIPLKAEVKDVQVQSSTAGYSRYPTFDRVYNVTLVEKDGTKHTYAVQRGKPRDDGKRQGNIYLTTDGKTEIYIADRKAVEAGREIKDGFRVGTNIGSTTSITPKSGSYVIPSPYKTISDMYEKKDANGKNFLEQNGYELLGVLGAGYNDGGLRTKDRGLGYRFNASSKVTLDTLGSTPGLRRGYYVDKNGAMHYLDLSQSTDYKADLKALQKAGARAISIFGHTEEAFQKNGVLSKGSDRMAWMVFDKQGGFMGVCHTAESSNRNRQLQKAFPNHGKSIALDGDFYREFYLLKGKQGNPLALTFENAQLLVKKAPHGKKDGTRMPEQLQKALEAGAKKAKPARKADLLKGFEDDDKLDKKIEGNISFAPLKSALKDSEGLRALARGVARIPWVRDTIIDRQLQKEFPDSKPKSPFSFTGLMESAKNFLSQQTAKLPGLGFVVAKR